MRGEWVWKTCEILVRILIISMFIFTPCSITQICKFQLLGILDKGYYGLSVLYLTNSCQSKIKSKFEIKEKYNANFLDFLSE